MGGGGNPKYHHEETLIPEDAHPKPKFLLNGITHLPLGALVSSLVMPGTQEAPSLPGNEPHLATGTGM